MNSYLDHFPDKWVGGSSKEIKVKVITKILKEMQRRCQGRWDVNKMADDCSPSNQQQPAEHSLDIKHPQVHREQKAEISAPRPKFSGNLN